MVLRLVSDPRVVGRLFQLVGPPGSPAYEQRVTAMRRSEMGGQLEPELRYHLHMLLLMVACAKVQHPLPSHRLCTQPALSTPPSPDPVYPPPTSLAAAIFPTVLRRG